MYIYIYIYVCIYTQHARSSSNSIYVYVDHSLSLSLSLSLFLSLSLSLLPAPIPWIHQPSLSSSPLIQEIYYYCGQAKKVDQTNTTADCVELNATTSVDSQTLAQLTSEQGPLHAGVLPTADCASAEGEKSLWEAMQKNPVVKIKKQKPEKREEAEEVNPKTPKEIYP